MNERTATYLEQVELALGSVRQVPMTDADAPADGFADAAATDPVAALMRTARTIVEYVLAACRRPSVSDANLQFAFPLGELWGRPALTPAEVLSRSLITVQAFARTAETQALRGDAGRVRDLQFISSALREVTSGGGPPEGRPRRSAADSAWYAHLREGDRWGDVLGYQAPTSAARATTVWRCVSELRASLESGTIELPDPAPAVPATPLLPTPSTALRRYDDLNLSTAWKVEPDPTPKKHAGDTVEVWFGTTRALRPGTTSEFGPERSSELLLGQCYVFVPNAHRRGSSGSSLWKQLIRLDFRDDTLKLQKTILLGEEFDATLRERLGDTGSKRALLYIHGYNSAFENAVVCAAQLAVDLRIEGVVAAFSWPSRASEVEYIPDLSQAEAAWEHLIEFLDRLRASGVEELDIIVHSMGNRVLSWAMERLAGREVVIDSLYLAAADLDPEILRQRSAFYRSVCGSITSYASTSDKALGLSSFLHGVDRVGLAPPVSTMDGMVTIDVSAVDDSFIGHGYFAMSTPVLDDIAAAMRGVAPGPERRLSPSGSSTRRAHWKLSRAEE
jgi:esterase/lipase superfamily enzyme